MPDVLLIDGAEGEGGGQILRSALALSIITRRPFRMDNVRAKRSRPGLMRQHLTAVTAAAQICGATVDGAAIGSSRLAFAPKDVRPGDYHFAIGTAGSTTLVLQTILPPLLHAAGPSRVTLEGGTHNPNCPPFDFLARTFLPLVNRMGPTVTARLERYGFYPAGGGRLVFDITPAATLQPIELLTRGPVTARRARALVANLPRHIGERELAVVRAKLNWPDDALTVEETRNSPGPGNALMLEVESKGVTEVFTAFGAIGVSAEAVAERAVGYAREYLAAPDVPVGECLADQLLLPLALAGGGAFVTTKISRHTATNIDLIAKFLPARIMTGESDGGRWLVRVES